MDVGHRHPITQLPHQATSSNQISSPMSAHFSYRLTTARLPQVSIITPILTNPQRQTEPPSHMRDSILGTLSSSLRHVAQRGRSLTSLTVPEIEHHYFLTQVRTTSDSDPNISTLTTQRQTHFFLTPTTSSPLSTHSTQLLLLPPSTIDIPSTTPSTYLSLTASVTTSSNS